MIEGLNLVESHGSIDDSSILKWRQKVLTLGFTDFVSPEDGFKSCGKSRWQNDKASGVYCWIAENGEAYVGQTVAARRRLLDHWKNHKDFLAAAFMRVDSRSLDEVERDCINQIAGSYATRNIKHAISTSAYVPFDSLVSERDRQIFLSGETRGNDLPWRRLDILEQKQTSQFQRFKKKTASQKLCRH